VFFETLQWRGKAGALIRISTTALILVLAMAAPLEPQPHLFRDGVWPDFSDRRDKAGVRFKHSGSPTSEKYLIETMGGGVGVLDYNNDGRLDIFLVNGGRLQDPMPARARAGRSEPQYFNRLYRNNTDGTFNDVTLEAGVSGAQDGSYGMGVATGDFNNDGFVDLYVTNFGRNILYRNNGDGAFRDVTDQAGVAVGGWSASAGFFDFDNDGWLDLFVTRYLDWDFSKNIPCGVPFTAYCSPEKFEPVSNLLYHNNRDGTFSDVSAASGISNVLSKGLGVAFNDYNQDGLTDICVACDRVPQLLFRNNGDGTFSEQALEAGLAFDEDGGVFSGMGVDFSDFNNDGLPDVLITTLAKEMYAFYRNEGHGRYSYVTRPSRLGLVSMLMSGWGTRFVDFDNDGWKDLFVAQGHVLDNIERIDPTRKYLQPPLLCRNEKGKFADVSVQSGPVFQQPIAGRGAAFGDLDNDGDIDVVMGVLNDYPRILYNEAQDRGSHWLLIKLAGTMSNRDGIGARVKLEGSSGLKQWASVSTAGSYLSSSDKRVHFGLGLDELIKTIEVKWPSGIRQELKNVKANQILTVIEPRSSEGLK
jgi:enediyne biosynthesis protein E4